MPVLDRRRPSALIVLATALVIAACGDPGPEATSPPAAAPGAPDPGAPPVVEPAPPVAGPAPADPEPPTAPDVPEPVLAAQQALLAAVRSGDWDEVAALLPSDGAFRAGFGNPEDPIEFFRSLPRDPRPEWIVILTQPPGRVLDLTVWPELYAREAFVIGADERAALETAYGAESIRGWEAAGMYLGWRAGFDADGTWRFMVAGD